MGNSTISKGVTRHTAIITSSKTIASKTAEVIVDLGEIGSSDSDRIISVLTNDQAMPNLILFPIYYGNHTYIKAFNAGGSDVTVSANQPIQYYTL